MMNKNERCEKLDLGDLHNLHQIVTSKDPLSNRKVMIPVTSKAFFEGKLTPSLRIGADAVEEEQVVVKLGQGYLADMTKDEASRYIERKMKALRPLVVKDTKASVSETRKVKQGTKLKMKKGFLQSQKPPPAKKSAANSRQPPKKKLISAPLPFIEIREEFDMEGNEIKSEAVNMSKQLHDVRREIQSQKGGSGEKNEIVDTLLESVPQSVNVEEDEQATGTAEIDTPFSNDPQNDVRPYQEISARLDELILLEEEEMKKKSINAKSSKRIQGKGWKKGFLSKDRQVSKKQNKPSAKKPIAVESSISNPAPSQVIDDPTRTKKVQFLPSNEVKEIPRIGTRSIESVKPPSQSTPPVHDMFHNTIQNRSTSQSRPSKSIQLGNIIERSNSNPTSDTGSRAGTDTSTEPKKKLSKFAQRRQEQKW